MLRTNLSSWLSSDELEAKQWDSQRTSKGSRERKHVHSGREDKLDALNIQVKALKFTDAYPKMPKLTSLANATAPKAHHYFYMSSPPPIPAMLLKARERFQLEWSRRQLGTIMLYQQLSTSYPSLPATCSIVNSFKLQAQHTAQKINLLHISRRTNNLPIPNYSFFPLTLCLPIHSLITSTTQMLHCTSTQLIYMVTDHLYSVQRYINSHVPEFCQHEHKYSVTSE